MLRSVRYFNSAKLILSFGLVICALACGAYGVLLLPAVKGLKFDPLCLVAVGIIALCFALVAAFTALIGSICASREKKAYRVMCENTVCAVEESEASPETVEAAENTEAPETPEAAEAAEENGEESGENTAPVASEAVVVVDIQTPSGVTTTAKLDEKTLKKIGKVAVPVATACVVAVAIAARTAKENKAKNRKKLYRWLG